MVGDKDEPVTLGFTWGEMESKGQGPPPRTASAVGRPPTSSPPALSRPRKWRKKRRTWSSTMPGAPVVLPAGFVTSASDAIGHLEDELQSQTALRREQDKLASGSAAAARPPTRGRALAGQQANPDIPTVNAMVPAAAGSGHIAGLMQGFRNSKANKHGGTGHTFHPPAHPCSKSHLSSGNRHDVVLLLPPSDFSPTPRHAFTPTCSPRLPFFPVHVRGGRIPNNGRR